MQKWIYYFPKGAYSKIVKINQIYLSILKLKLNFLFLFLLYSKFKITH